MKSKRLSVLLIACVFFVVMLVSCFTLFSVKKIQVNYAVGESTVSENVQAKLDKFLNKNLLFVSEKDVVDSLKEFHYMKVVSVDKQYPNVIKVELEQRKEVYEIVYNNTAYVTDETGFVLDSYPFVDSSISERDKIRIHLNEADGVAILNGDIGKVISTNEDEFVKQVFKMAMSVNLSNCIDSIKLEKAVERDVVCFNTYTGVKILIREVFDDGENKVKEAFDVYDEGPTDYQKTYGVIEAIKLVETGKIQAQWSEE